MPETGNTTFWFITLENVTLHVPASALEAYKSTDPWSEFKNIVALTDEDYAEGIDNLTPALSQGEEAIYNLQGQRINGFSESSVPSVLPKGVYIVDGKKVWVK